MTETQEPTQKEQEWQSSVEYAGFYARMGAMAIDSMIVLLPISILFAGIFASAMGGENITPEDLAALQAVQDDPDAFWRVFKATVAESLARLLLENLIVTVASGAAVVAMWYYLSATPGKLLMGMKLVNAKSGRPTSLHQNILRYLGYFVSTLPLMLGFFWAAWDKRKQTWHDKMAGTVVVYKRSLPDDLATLTHRKKATVEQV